MGLGQGLLCHPDRRAGRYLLADCRIDLHPDACQPAGHSILGRSPQVLRLGLHARPENGGRSRLRADARQRRAGDGAAVEGAGQRRRRKTCLRGDELSPSCRERAPRGPFSSLLSSSPPSRIRPKTACSRPLGRFYWRPRRSTVQGERLDISRRPSMVDVALRGAPMSEPIAMSRARTLIKLRVTDSVFRHLTRGAAVSVLIILGGVIISLISGSLPAIRTFGLNFLLNESWNPVTEKFGALPAIYGTLVTSLIAMLIAVPLGLLITLFLTELCPMWLRRPISIAIELLAGIPSILYGIRGLFVFAPFLQVTLQQWLIDAFGPVPILSHLFAGPPYGIGMLTAGLILAIMVLP